MRPFLVILCVLGPFVAAFSQSYTISVAVTGLHSDKGKVYMSLYNSEKGYPKDASVAYRLSFAAIQGRAATVVFAGIPKGTYAIACFHDENNNGKLDANFLGIPKEGTGASNDARGSMGPPKFKDAKFQLVSDTTLTIRMNY